MKTIRTLFQSFVPALCGMAMMASPVAATPLPAAPYVRDMVVMAASDCYAIGQDVAAENGGTLAKASQSTQDGQAVCVIVVLVPGKDGQRPRRTEIVVPQD